MTKGTKIFRVIISILLGFTMLCSLLFSTIFYLYLAKKPYGIHVAGVSVNIDNQDDILGDGTVKYDSTNNILIFDNANIEFEDVVVYSDIDLNIRLIGENKFVSTSDKYGVGVYTGKYNINNDLVIEGDGSLTIEVPNAKEEAVGIYAANLVIMADVTVTSPNCERNTNGIICASSLLIAQKATVTVNSGTAKFSSAVRVRGNVFFEEGTALKASVNPGNTETCKGLTINGDLLLGKDAVLDVSVDDGTTDAGECIRVTGLMEIGSGATVTAFAKNANAIECFGTIEANKGATISAASEKNDADIFCSGAIVNRGAEFEGEIDAIGGIHNRD